MMKQIGLMLLVVLCMGAGTNTTTFIDKYFTVSNMNPDATGPLIGTATLLNTNSPFSIPTNISFSVMGTQYYNAYVRLDTSKTGKFTNYVCFLSNGGNSTNMVFGSVLPNKVANFHFQ